MAEPQSECLGNAIEEVERTLTVGANDWTRWQQTFDSVSIEHVFDPSRIPLPETVPFVDEDSHSTGPPPETVPSVGEDNHSAGPLPETVPFEDRCSTGNATKGRVASAPEEGVDASSSSQDTHKRKADGLLPGPIKKGRRAIAIDKEDTRNEVLAGACASLKDPPSYSEAIQLNGTAHLPVASSWKAYTQWDSEANGTHEVKVTSTKSVPPRLFVLPRLYRRQPRPWPCIWVCGDPSREAQANVQFLKQRLPHYQSIHLPFKALELLTHVFMPLDSTATAVKRHYRLGRRQPLKHQDYAHPETLAVRIHETVVTRFYRFLSTWKTHAGHIPPDWPTLLVRPLVHMAIDEGVVTDEGIDWHAALRTFAHTICFRIDPLFLLHWLMDSATTPYLIRNWAEEVPETYTQRLRWLEEEPDTVIVFQQSIAVSEDQKQVDPNHFRKAARYVHVQGLLSDQDEILWRLLSHVAPIQAPYLSFALERSSILCALQATDDTVYAWLYPDGHISAEAAGLDEDEQIIEEALIEDVSFLVDVATPWRLPLVYARGFREEMKSWMTPVVPQAADPV